jgi:hypothetical protein
MKIRFQKSIMQIQFIGSHIWPLHMTSYISIILIHRSTPGNALYTFKELLETSRIDGGPIHTLQCHYRKQIFA